MGLVPNLRNRVALVTGASRGIGRAAALALAAVNYREREAEAREVVAGIRARGRRAVAAPTCRTAMPSSA